MKNNKATTFSKFINESEDYNNKLEIDETILDKLVDLVGSEEDVENAAKEAFEELQKSFDENKIEISDEDSSPKRLVLSALLVKLVEFEKLNPEDADEFLDLYL